MEFKIICPECRKEAKVPAGGVQYLPTNFFINSLMDKLGLKRKVDNEVLNCNECVKDEPVVAYCQMCSSYLCQFCCEHHKRSKKFCDHKTVTIAKLRSNKNITIQPNTISLTCKEHDTAVLFYCETCEQLVCKHCVFMRHYGHNYNKARIQACKCQIELEAIAVDDDLSEAHDSIEELKRVRLFYYEMLWLALWQKMLLFVYCMGTQSSNIACRHY